MESGIEGWMSVKEMMPDPEERVLLCTVSTVGGKKYKHITIGIYEDGKINEYARRWLILTCLSAVHITAARQNLSTRRCVTSA